MQRSTLGMRESHGALQATIAVCLIMRIGRQLWLSLNNINNFPKLKSLLTGNNGDNKQILQAFSYFPTNGIVNVEIDMSQNLTTSMAKGYLKSQISDIYTDLFTQKGANVTTATVVVDVCF